MDHEKLSLEEEDDISQSTLYVLGLLGTFFIATLVYISFRALNKLKGKPITHSNPQSGVKNDEAQRKSLSEHVVQDPKGSRTRAVEQVQKPGISLKQLVKQSQQATTRQAAVDKPVDHPLYLNSLKGFHSNVVGLSISLVGKVATVTEDQVLKVFDIRDLSSKSFPSQRTSLARVPVDVAFAKSTEVFVLTEGPLGNAILELFNLEASKLSQEWETADVHGKEAGKGVLAGVTQYGLSVALTYSGQTDLQVFTAKAKPLASVNSSGLQNHGAALSRQGRFLGAATFTSDVKIHELQFDRDGGFKKAQKVMDLKYAHKGQVYCLDFSPEETKAVTASKDGTWVVWNIDVRYAMDEDPKILVKNTQETGGARYTHLAFGPQGIVAAAFGSTLHFLDSRNGALLEEVQEAHDGPIVALQWSPIPHTFLKSKIAVLVSSGMDKRVRLWRAPIT